MLRPIDNYFPQQQEPVKSCLPALRELLLYCTRDKNVRKNFCPGSEAMSIPEKSGFRNTGFFVQAIFPCSTLLHRPLVLNTIGQL